MELQGKAPPDLPTGDGNVAGNMGIPAEYGLAQNFPNPFNPTSTITFSLPSAQTVRLTVYNILAQEVATLVNGKEEAGSWSVNFDASNLTSGIYLYRLQAEKYTEVRKMVLLK